METLCYGLGKLAKIVEVAGADLIDDGPVNGVIAMNGDIPEPDGLLHAFGERRRNDLRTFQDFEVLSHRRRRSGGGVYDEMRREVDAELNGALEIQGDDILQIGVPDQFLGGRRRLAGQPLDTAPK